MKKVTKCRCCGSNDLYLYLDLKDQPLANSYHKGEKLDQYPLEVELCKKCFHSQLSVVIDPKIMFEHYLYVSGTTQTFRKHCADFALEAINRYNARNDIIMMDCWVPPRVLDIACFPSANVIANNYKVKDISDVKIGDKVLDQKGNFTTVINIYEKYFNGELICVKPRGTDSRLITKSTPEHPYLVFRLPNKKALGKQESIEIFNKAKPIWAEAKDLKKGDYLVLPRQKHLSFIDCIDVSIFGGSDNKFVYSLQTNSKGIIEKARNTKELPKLWDLDKNLGKLIGYYLAEGSGKGHKNGTLSFSFNTNENDYMEEVKNILFEKFGLDSKIQKNKGNSSSVLSNSCILKNIFQSFVGTKAFNKKLPDFTYDSPKEFIYGLLQGYWRGDGSATGDVIKFDTISPTLAYQIRYLLLQFNINSSIVLNKPSGFGKKNGKTLYSVRVYSKQDRIKLNSILENNFECLGNEINRYPLNDEYKFIRIDNVYSEKFEGKVYNLETESNTYVVDQFVVHNCNDGTLLECFRTNSCKVYGVDPSVNIREITKSKNIPVEVGLWGDEVAEKVGKFDIITATNVFAHVDSVDGFLNACKKSLKPSGFVVIEFPYCKSLIAKNEFDTVYHEHLSYFLVNSFSHLTRRCGFEIFDIIQTPIHGSSIRFFIRESDNPDCKEVQELIDIEKEKGLLNLETYQKFEKQVLNTKDVFVEELSKQKRKVIGYGASAKGNTMLNFFDLKLDYIVDDNAMKWGYMTPGMDILIVSPETLRTEESPLAIVILSWNFAKEIVRKITSFRLYNDDVIFLYVPETKVINIPLEDDSLLSTISG